MACLSYLLPRRKENHHMEVTEGLHTLPSKGGVIILRVLPFKDLSHWTGSFPCQQQPFLSLNPWYQDQVRHLSGLLEKSLGMGGMNMEKILPYDGICHLKGFLVHPLSTKVWRHEENLVSEILYLLTLLLSYILHRASSVQWLAFNQVSCVAQDQIFLNVLHLRRQGLMYTEHCSNSCSST